MEKIIQIAGDGTSIIALTSSGRIWERIERMERLNNKTNRMEYRWSEVELPQF